MTAVLHYKPEALDGPGLDPTSTPSRPTTGSSIRSRPVRGASPRRDARGTFDPRRHEPMTAVQLLVGTPKGAFILDSDERRRDWQTARSALRGVADPRPHRRAEERRDPRGRRQPVVRPGGVAERRRGRDVDPLERRASTYGDEAATDHDDLEPRGRARRRDPRRCRTGRPVPERGRRRDVVARRGAARPPIAAGLAARRRRVDPAHDHPPPDRPGSDVGRDLGRGRVRDA